MTDQELKDLVASLADKSVQLDSKLANLIEVETREREENARSRRETDRVLRETDRQLQELGRQIGGLGEKFGSFTEGMALPSMQKILTDRFKMDVVAPQVRARKNGRSMELDVLAIPTSDLKEAYVVEVKSHLREDAIEQLRKTLQEFRDFFPMHQDKRVYGILAAVDTPDDVRDKALREGFYLARIHDGQFEMQVPDGFQPRAF